MLKPIKNSIIIQFLDSTNSNGTFSEVTNSGIVIASQRTDFDTQRIARWATAVAVGPDCLDVKQGDIVLVEGLGWTTHFKHEGEKFWKTDENKIMAITDSIESTRSF